MQQGNLSSADWFRGIGKHIIDHGPGWRTFLARDGLQIIILPGGGSKARRQRDIAAGNPTMTNLAAIFSALKRALTVEITAHAVAVA
jgi:putative component of toxin-antitoxin plasmid stabilization module